VPVAEACLQQDSNRRFNSLLKNSAVLRLGWLRCGRRYMLEALRSRTLAGGPELMAFAASSSVGIPRTGRMSSDSSGQHSMNLLHMEIRLTRCAHKVWGSNSGETFMASANTTSVLTLLRRGVGRRRKGRRTRFFQTPELFYSLMDYFHSVSGEFGFRISARARPDSQISISLRMALGQKQQSSAGERKSRFERDQALKFRPAQHLRLASCLLGTHRKGSEHPDFTRPADYGAAGRKTSTHRKVCTKSFLRIPGSGFLALRYFPFPWESKHHGFPCFLVADRTGMPGLPLCASGSLPSRPCLYVFADAFASER
jgi:hypothetical protein